ncbi:hypothetical protein KIPB_009374 [Kipferlia bialata]|uniref:Uncharacterized protein n=1 Tax=Kipferlia bialata TaxID=797122 RepID=A0A9K3D3J2_9EUKA|nr:hypothetical protein KIPB_009374 [Kipferlia bialata]|eukprot:g9374.t1
MAYGRNTCPNDLECRLCVEVRVIVAICLIVALGILGNTSWKYSVCCSASLDQTMTVVQRWSYCSNEIEAEGDTSTDMPSPERMCTVYGCAVYVAPAQTSSTDDWYWLSYNPIGKRVKDSGPVDAWCESMPIGTTLDLVTLPHSDCEPYEGEYGLQTQPCAFTEGQVDLCCQTKWTLLTWMGGLIVALVGVLSARWIGKKLESGIRRRKAANDQRERDLQEQREKSARMEADYAERWSQQHTLVEEGYAQSQGEGGNVTYP